MGNRSHGGLQAARVAARFRTSLAAGVFLFAVVAALAPAVSAQLAVLRDPRIVLPAFVVRCDTTPDTAARASRPSYCVNVEGEGIADPGADPTVPALEAEPELRWEAFDEYWRKIHGPKIIHQEGSADVVTQLLLRYEQQHRIPGGPTSAKAPPYAPQVGADGLLIPDPHANVAGYSRPSFDGLAQLAYATRADLDAFFGLAPGDKYLEKIIPDERVFLKGFAFNLSREFIIIPDEGTRDPIIFIKTHERAPGLSRGEFLGLWLNSHAQLVVGNPDAARYVKRYAQLHNVSVPEDAPFFDPVGDQFDGITVMSFANVTELEAFLASDGYAAIAADEAVFTGRSEFFTAVDYIIRIDAAPEQATVEIRDLDCNDDGAINGLDLFGIGCS